jgi:hypothetical protein
MQKNITSSSSANDVSIPISAAMVAAMVGAMTPNEVYLPRMHNW